MEFELVGRRKWWNFGTFLGESGSEKRGFESIENDLKMNEEVGIEDPRNWCLKSDLEREIAERRIILRAKARE